MVKGLIGIAHNPGDLAPGEIIREDFPEEEHRGERAYDRHIVHFDLDPRNGTSLFSHVSGRWI